MARSRRGGTPDLKGTLGTLIRTTLNQVGAMTGVAREAARNQRGRLDSALLERRRLHALADLGERVYELAASGQLGDLEELPEIGRALDAIEQIEERLAEDSTPARAWGRARRPAEPAAAEPYRVWRPNLGEAADPDPIAEAAETARPRTAPVRPSRRRPSRGPGGIAFVEDEAEAEDLAEYMHEDDLHRAKP